jgi:hypothetical protein
MSLKVTQIKDQLAQNCWGIPDPYSTNLKFRPVIFSSQNTQQRNCVSFLNDSVEDVGRQEGVKMYGRIDPLVKLLTAHFMQKVRLWK